MGHLDLLASGDVPLNAGNTSWMLMSAALVLLMTPAVAFFYGGMSRQKSVLNMMMMSFGALGVVGVIYILWGWSMSYGGTSLGGFVGNPFEQYGLHGLVEADTFQTVNDSGYPVLVDVSFQLTFAVLTVALISGALAERVKFGTWLLFSALWVTVAYFPVAHMVWNGGLLSDSESGIAAKLFGTEVVDGETVASVVPIDFAGGTVVHINAGIAALALVLIIGQRQGFGKTAYRPHNLPFVMLGAALLWFGWFGFNAGSAFAADAFAGLAWVNTTAATCAAMVGWLLTERLRDGHATSLGAASGVVAGLVAITPAAGSVSPVGSILLGAIAGALCAYGVGLKHRFGFDDSLDVVGVHLIAGIWGTISIGLFATGDYETNAGLFYGGGGKLFVVQTAIALVALVYTAIVTTILGLLLSRTMGWRVEYDAEQAGIDSAEHAESAYEQNSGQGLSVR